MGQCGKSRDAYAEVPLNGVKDSGYGSKGGTEALKTYQNVKFIFHTMR